VEEDLKEKLKGFKQPKQIHKRNNFFSATSNSQKPEILRDQDSFSK